MTTKAKAAEAATPDEPPATQAAGTTSSTDVASNWRYTGGHVNTYAAVPVTVEPDDVIFHLGPPADDGRWEPTDAEVTRHRDNHQEG